MVRKIFFCSEFPVILESWWRKEKKEKQLRNFLVTQANAKSVLPVWRHALAGWLLSYKHAASQGKSNLPMRAQFNEDEDTQSLHDEKNLAIPQRFYTNIRINWGRRIRCRTRFTFKAIVNLFSYWKIRS